MSTKLGKGLGWNLLVTHVTEKEKKKDEDETNQKQEKQNLKANVKALKNSVMVLRNQSRAGTSHLSSNIHP